MANGQSNEEVKKKNSYYACLWESRSAGGRRQIAAPPSLPRLPELLWPERASEDDKRTAEFRKECNRRGGETRRNIENNKLQRLSVSAVKEVLTAEAERRRENE